jgi:thymidine phosphorylase
VALGGPPDLLERPDRHLPEAPVRRAVTPEHAGVVTRIDTRMLGLAVLALGGGRRRGEDAVHPAVGLAEVAGLGVAVGRDRPLAWVHARSTGDAEAAGLAVRTAMTVDEVPPAVTPPVLHRIGPAPHRRP